MPLTTEQVWHDVSDGLRGYLRRRVGDDQLAEDLLQETFLRIHDGLAGLCDEDRLAGWVQRVARNAIADHFRRPQREFPAEAVDHAVATPDDDTLDELLACVRPMVGDLPDSYREAVELAELDGLTQGAVGEQLGLSLSGAKSRVQRGRELLKQKLLECCHLEFDRRGNVVNYAKNKGCNCRCTDGKGGS